MKQKLTLFVDNFGFIHWDEFISSMFKKQYLYLTIPISLYIGYLQEILGFRYESMVALMWLLLIELTTGVFVSIKKKHRITSRRFSRFGLKLFMWCFFLYILNSVKFQFQPTNILLYELFDYLWGAVVVYIVLEYLISVAENFGELLGDKSLFLLKLLKKKRDKFIKDNLDEETTSNSK